MWLILIPFSVVVSLLFAYFRPYKNNLFNIIDCSAFALWALTAFLIMYAMTLMPFPMQVLYALALIPCLYFISFILYKILSRVALLRTFWTRIGEILKARRKAPQLPIHRDENIDEELPDRIVNPDMYKVEA